jgi:serine/threonine protein phosphatase PrpC
MHAIWTAQQIQGGRDYQEDSLAVVENDTVYYAGQQYELGHGIVPAQQSLYILVDGMGGMENGSIAAEAVIETFIEIFLNLAQTDEPMAQKLKASLRAANNEIKKMVAENDAYEGMGCTLLAVLFDCQQNTLQWVSVGDSPLYLINKKEIVRLNEKHTWGELAKQKRAQGEEIDEEHYRKVAHFLSSAVDGKEIEFIDLHDEPLHVEHGNVLLLASDGIETLSLAEIGDALPPLAGEVASTTSVEDVYKFLVQARKNLIGAVEQAGRKDQDNTSLVLCTFWSNSLVNEQQ